MLLSSWFLWCFTYCFTFSVFNIICSTFDLGLLCAPHFVFSLVLITSIQCIFIHFTVYTPETDFFFFFCPAVMCMWKGQALSYLSCMCSTHCSCFTEGHIQYFSGGALLILILYFVIPPKVVIVLSQLQCVFSAADTHL